MKTKGTSRADEGSINSSMKSVIDDENAPILIRKTKNVKV